MFTINYSVSLTAVARLYVNVAVCRVYSCALKRKNPFRLKTQLIREKAAFFTILHKRTFLLMARHSGFVLFFRWIIELFVQAATMNSFQFIATVRGLDLFASGLGAMLLSVRSDCVSLG